MISNDNKFTLKPIFVFLPFLIIHTFIIVMETIYCFFIVVLFRMGGLAGLGGWGGTKQVPLQLPRSSLLSMEQRALCPLKKTQGWSLVPVIQQCFALFLFIFFFCYRQSRRMTNTQNTARHSTTESKLHSTRIRDLLKKDVVWLNNYNALDVVDEDCYTSLRKLQKGGLPCFQLFFFFLNIRF